MKKLFLSIVLLLPSLFCHGIYIPELGGELVEIEGIYYLIGNDYASIPELPDDIKMLADYEGDITIQNSVLYEGVSYPVTYIWPNAFNGFSNLRSVEIANTVKSIGNNAFSHCKKLVHVAIPDGITTIEKGMFFRSGIKSVDIPKSVTTIEDLAFAYCDSIVIIQFPDNITEMGVGIFEYCNNLTTVILPAHLKTIRSEAFDGCTNLSTVVLPEELSAIHSYSFRGCSSLTSIEWPESLETISDHAFQFTGLTSIRLPDRVNDISGYAFSNCSSLKTAILGHGLCWIGPDVFENCNELTDLYCYAETPPQLDWSYDGARYQIFSSDFQGKVTLHVPASAIDLYKTDRMWSGFTTIVSINDTPDSISEIDTDLTTTSQLLDSMEYYDLQGRRLATQPTKGIYIQNGKKVVVK